MAPAFDCPALAYGPGDAALDHSPRERVEITEVLRAIEVLEGALLACGVLPSGGSRAPSDHQDATYFDGLGEPSKQVAEN